METTSQRKYFKGLRALALTALFCTIALTLFIWGEALTPGDKSAIQSMKVSDNIQSAMKSDEPAPPVSAVTGYVVKSVRRDGKVLTDVDHYYTGDVLELGVKCLPENADTSKLYFERGFDESEDYINVEENGEVTLSKWGYHRVVVKSKDNPDNVLYDLKIYNEGVNPDKVKGIKTKIFLGNDILEADEDEIITLKTCEEYFLSVTAETDDEYNGYGVSTIETEILIDGEKHNANDKIFFLPAKQWFYPLKTTDGDYLTLEIKLGDKTVSQRIRIVEGSKPEATGFTFGNKQRVTKNDDGSFSLAMKKDEHLVITSQLGFRAENASKGAPSNIISKSSDTNVVNASTTHLHAYKPGTATITYFSIYDNTITATLHVTVPDVVDGLTVVAPRQMRQRRQNRSHRLYGRQRHEKREMGSCQRRRLNRRKRRVYVRQIGQSHRARNVRRPPRPYRRKNDYRVSLRHLPHAYTKRARTLLAFPCAGVRIVRHVLPAY